MHRLKLFRHGCFPDAKYKPFQISNGFYLRVFLGAGESTLQRLGGQSRKGFAVYARDPRGGAGGKGAFLSGMAAVSLGRDREGAVAPAWLLFSGL